MEYLKLGEISEFIMGQAPNSENCNKNGSGTIFVKAGQFGELYPNIEEWTVTPLKMAKENDVLICVVGATVGKLNLAIDCAIGRSVAAIRCDSKKLHYKYLYYYLNTWVTRIRELSQGSAIGVITKDMLYDLNIPMYDISSQIYIVNILDKAQKLMDKRKQQIEALDELVKSKFIEMFGDPILNPKNWEKSMLQECCFKITDGTHDTPKRLSNGKLLITGKNIRRDKIDLTDIEYVSEEDHQMIYKRCNPEYGDVLYTNIGANYGTAVINSLNYEFSMKNVALLKPNNDKIIGIYLWHYLNLCRPYILEQNKAGGAQTFMSLATIKKLNIFVPSLELQNQFADFVKQVDKLKFEMENSLKELEDNFNSLMQKSFKGELFN